jgi:hypothetical protein
MTRTVRDVLDQEYLVARAKILELAAILDRLDRANEAAAEDPRYGLLRQGMELLQQPEDGRAERVQLHFSRPYQATWRQEFGV